MQALDPVETKDWRHFPTVTGGIRRLPPRQCHYAAPIAAASLACQKFLIKLRTIWAMY